MIIKTTTTIQLETLIQAPMEAVFNLSLDIDFHKNSASQTQGQTIAGVQTGKIGLGETVTWRGKHFGFWFTHTSIISANEAPFFFTDEMTAGYFKKFKHEHRFRKSDKNTLMIDRLIYTIPCGLVGGLFDFLFLEKHLSKFLKTRNLKLKTALESNFLL